MSQVASLPKRFYFLDVLRGLAAVLVLIRHVPKPYTNLSYSQYSSWDAQLMVQLIELGWIGVDLFFVLSGFLISGLLYKEIDDTGSLNVKRFLLRRGFKIWPCYFVAYGGMTLLLIIRAILEQNQSQVKSALANGFWNAVFLQNYVKCVRWPHSWSIAVEEHFYIFLPLLFLFILSLCKKRLHKLSAIPWVCLAIIILCPAMRLLTLFQYNSGWMWDTDYYNWYAVYYPSHMRADSLCFGVLIGYIFRYHHSLAISITSRKYIGIPLVITSFAIPLLWHIEEHWFCGTIGFTLIALGFSWLVLSAGVFPETGKNGNRLITIPCNILAWIGIYSYTIYLAHSIIFGISGVDWLRRKLIRFSGEFVSDGVLLWIDYSYFWILSILLGLLLSKLIEQPLLKIRSKLVPSHYANRN